MKFEQNFRFFLIKPIYRKSDIARDVFLKEYAETFLVLNGIMKGIKCGEERQKQTKTAVLVVRGMIFPDGKLNLICI